LYSRQLAVLGHEAMTKMQSSNVLVIGMQGLGLEVAKNVALGGVASLSIFDPAPAEMVDLASQYYIRETELGKPRAEITQPRLAELNPHVPIKIHPGAKIKVADLAQYQVVVLTNRALVEELEINEFTHANNICFISAAAPGLFGKIFTDFGPAFTVSDATGETPKSNIIQVVTSAGEGIVSCPDDARHGLETGDYVSFAEVIGMVELNGAPAQPIKVLGPYSFSIGDTSKMSEYVRGGIFTQVKQPKTMAFKCLKDSLTSPVCDSPMMGATDFAKFERPMQLHVAFQAVDQYRAKNGTLPQPGDAAAAAAVVAAAMEIAAGLAEPVEVDDKLVATFASQSIGNLISVTAFVGGIAAQEVMKACSGKFSPIMQHLYFDSLESLPEDVEIPAASLQPQGNRYDGQVAVIGKELQTKLGAARYFLVGAGAIGCELLKNFAMMGLAAGAGGEVIVTDMDIIETSNLNRQFLFRPKDVKQPKSHTAAAAAQEMNPAFNIVAHENCVGTDTENIYGDEFFGKLHGVTNALDNVEARQYMDRRCVFYGKPLLESGTLGSKGNTQVVLPHQTESYSSSQDPPEASIPLCTLKNFPHKPEHTLQWARDHFEGVFAQNPSSINSYLSDPAYVEGILKQPGSQPVDALTGILTDLVESRPMTFADCVAWARHEFQNLFHNGIAQLLYNFPKDQITKDGEPFWSGTKRCPHPIDFDASDELHIGFIVAAANLRAQVYNLKGSTDVAGSIAATLKSVVVPPFAAKTGMKIAANEKEAEEMKKAAAEADAAADPTEILKKLPSPATLAGFRVTPLEFEKDDDTNFHIAYVAAVGNLRGSNYEMKQVTNHEAKMIAGKIIPAIATTTAVVAGLVGLELLKLVGGNKKIESYKNGFLNLALNQFIPAEPVACAKQKYNETEWTLWDRFDLKSPMTLREFIDYFEEAHKLEVQMLSCGVSMLYSFFMPPAKLKERMSMPMHEIVETVSQSAIPAHQKYLIFEICVDDTEGEEVEVPFVQYKL
jgi:ubiquitin-activating enzyme E1